MAATLLNNLGIDAQPALVSTTWRHQLPTRLPSPGVFDHVILRVALSGKVYWIDVTNNAQGGTLDTLVQSNLGMALVIAPGQSAPQTIPEEKAETPLIVSNIEYDLKKGIDKGAAVTIVTTYYRSEADWMRSKMRTSKLEELGRQYLDYYKRRYPDIESTKAIQLKDDPIANEYVVTEYYRIATPFSANDQDSGLREFEVVADTINDRLRTSESRVRTHPLGLYHPIHVTQSIVVRMPDSWSIEESAQNIDTRSFHFDSHVTRNGNDVNLNYRYRVKTDHVATNDLNEYFKQREKARLDTYYTFSVRKPKPAKDKAVNQAAELLKKAQELEKSKSYKDAQQVLAEAEKSPGYSSLSEQQQQYHQYLSGWVAYRLDEDKIAHEYFVKSTSMNGADDADWRMRTVTALIIKDYSDAALSLTMLAERFPSKLNDMSDSRIIRTVANSPATGMARYKLLKALFTAKYTAGEGRDISWMWRDLALLQLERFETQAAVTSLQKLSDPETILSVLVDNRFSGVIAKIEPKLDIESAMTRRINLLTDRATKNPTKLDPIVQLTYSLLSAGKYEEALRATDAAIANESAASTKHYFDDHEDEFAWILDNRRRALMNLGRWDEGLRQQIQATRFGNDSVSQLINLGAVYNYLGKPQEAIKTIAAVNKTQASAYGVMQIAGVTLDAATQLGDKAEITRQFEYIRDHREDDESAYQDALIIMNRIDDAAALLISRLMDPDQRIVALLEIQDYLDYKRTPRQQEIHQRWLNLKKRKDVQEAVSKVGKISQFNFRRLDD